MNMNLSNTTSAPPIPIRGGQQTPICICGEVTYTITTRYGQLCPNNLYICALYHLTGILIEHEL